MLDLPIASHFSAQILLYSFKILRGQFADARMAVDKRPRHDGCDFAAVVERKPRTELEQFAEIWGSQLWHLEWPRLVWLRVDMFERWACRHQRMAGHVIPLAIIITFGRMVEVLLIRVV